jgi:hypothetical protein
MPGIVKTAIASLVLSALAAQARADIPTGPAPGGPLTSPAPPVSSTATSTAPSGSAPISTTKEDDEGTPKLSMPTESDRAAWTHSGFRLELAFVYGKMDGLRGAPSGRETGVLLHAGLRLDHDWSLMSTFEYVGVSQHLGLSGLRYMGTLDPTWHVTRAFSLAFGFGFGGFVEGSTGRPDDAQQATDVSITLPNASPPIPKCAGVGAAGLLRASYAWVMGPRSTFNAELEVDGQYTACVEPTGVVEPDTAQAIARTQYWPHVGITGAVGFAWR